MKGGDREGRPRGTREAGRARPRGIGGFLHRVRSLGDLRLALVLVVISLVSIASIQFATQGIRPRRIPLGEIGPGDVGLLVEIEGLVRSTRSFGADSLRLELVDGVASVGVFVPGTKPGSPPPEMLRPGTRVSATGEVTTYNGVVEIEAAGPAALTLLRRAGDESVGVVQLLSAPEQYRGMLLKVAGALGRPTNARGDLTVLLADASAGEARLLVVVGMPMTEQFSYRDPANAVGKFGFGYEGGPGWRLTVEEDWERLSKNSLPVVANATQVKIDGLMAAPEKFDGLLVQVSGLIVVDSTDAAGCITSLSSEDHELAVFVPRKEWKRTDILAGDEVVVAGRLEYFRPRGQWELIVDDPGEFVRAP